MAELQMTVESSEGNDMPTAPSAEHRRFLARLAREHYLQGRSKVEIGKDHGLSRFQVARHLQEALDTGVVTITIEADDSASDDLAEAVAAELGLDQVLVVDVDSDADRVATMGRAALGFVARHARPGMRIGLSWSRTLDAASAFVPALPRCTIVQMAGALQQATRSGEGIFARLGQDTAVSMVRLYAPLLVREADTASDLLALPEISETLQAADSLDLAVVSVAAWAQGLSSVWEKCTPDQHEASLTAGAIGEISGRLFAADGSAVTTIDDRVIAVTLDQLRAAAHTVGVARGAARAHAVQAACRAGVLDSLIIDADLAEALAVPGLAGIGQAVGRLTPAEAERSR